MENSRFHFLRTSAHLEMSEFLTGTRFQRPFSSFFFLPPMEPTAWPKEPKALCTTEASRYPTISGKRFSYSSRSSPSRRVSFVRACSGELLAGPLDGLD